MTCAPSSAWCRCSGRIAVSAGVLAVAGLSGWLADILSRETVFFIGLIIPAISVTGVFLRGNSRRRTASHRLAHPRRRHRLRRGGDRARRRRRAVRPGGASSCSRWRWSAPCWCWSRGSLDHEARMRHPVHHHHHLCVPRHAVGRRRLFLVDARRAQVRRVVLRHAASDRRDPLHRGDVDVQQADHRIFRHRRAVLDRGRGHHPVAAQHRPGLRPARMDRGERSASAPAASRSSTRRRPRRSCSSA